MKRTLLLLSLTLVLLACNKSDNESQVTILSNSEKSAKIIAADNQFGLELFQKVNASLTEPKNTMISPLSVSLALGMLYNGTAGNTKTQMEQMLHKAGMTPDDLNQSYQDLMKGLVGQDPKVELSISNAIYYSNIFSVKENFITTNKNFYQAEVSGLDFTNTAEAKKTVNGWVNTNTKGKIDRIIEEVKPEDVMYLLNAIYFNGEWTYPFDALTTKQMSFTKEDKTVVSVPKMKIENSFNYYDDQNLQMVEIPYGSGKYSMLVVLPETGKTTNTIISWLNPENLAQWTGHMTKQMKKVYLPKFEFKCNNSLVDELEALGMTDAFNAKRANFSGISDDRSLVISNVMHKTYLKVNEQGTEAAAVTEVTIYTTSSLDPGVVEKNFIADHPFVFAIREKDTGAILFIGKVMDPLQE